MTYIPFHRAGIGRAAPDVGHRQAALWEGFPQFYAEHRDQTVLVGVVTDDVLKGELVGLNTYDIILRLEGGTDVLLHRSNIVYVQKAK